MTGSVKDAAWRPLLKLGIKNMVRKLPAMQFYVGDWRKDPGVQSLSYEERGIWFELLCIMHESNPRGKLMLNNKAIPEPMLARLLGIDQDAMLRAVNKFLDYGIASRCEDTGAVMCRRMVRDEETREKRTEAGKKGGNPKLGVLRAERGYVYFIHRHSDGWTKIGASTQPDKRLFTLRRSQGDCLLTLRGKYLVENMGECESRLHEHFASFCERSGEWFNIPADFLENLDSEMRALDFTLSNHLKVKSRQSHRQSPRQNAEVEDEEEGEGVLPFDMSAAFDEFWSAYPVKIGKKSARAAYEKSVKALGNKSKVSEQMAAEKILAAVADYAEYVSLDGAPSVKYAQGWLNDERFEVDYVQLKDELLRKTVPKREPVKTFEEIWSHNDTAGV